jgi:hypothetical protein
MTSSAQHRLLLVGPSSFFQEAAPGFLLKDLLVKKLESGLAEPGACAAERLFFGRGMASRLQDLIERHDPEAVLLYLGSGPFELESVVQVIRMRWPRAYQPALKLSTRLKGVAGGGLEGSPGPRGWLYRLPRRLLARLTGVEAAVTLEEAITSSIDAINVLCRREDILPLVYFSAVSWPPSFRRALDMVAEFDRRIREHCQRRGVAYWFRQEEMARRGFEPQRGPDGIHADHATYTFEAGIVTELALRELDVETSASPGRVDHSPADRSPAPRA